MINRIRFLGCLVLVGILSGCEPEEPGQAKKAEKQKPEKLAAGAAGASQTTCKVHKGPLKAEATLKGVFEAEEMHELVLRPKAWTGLTVMKAVEHGTLVKKDDVLVELDLEKIDQAIKDLKTDRAIAEVTFKQAMEELPVLEKSLPLDLAAAERNKKQADEDLKRFLEVDKPLSVESAHNMVKNSKFYLESAQEELKQLQKMYRDKDLTEETEQFILKRQRHMVENAQFGLKSALIRSEQTLKIDVPRQEQSAREKAVKEELTLEKSRTLPLTLSQKRLALAKMKTDNDKSAERLAYLEKDREAMTVHAPADGIVYYGKCVRGQWSTGMGGGKLQRGSSILPEDVFMTIVVTRPVFVRATVEEKDLHLLRPEMKGKAVATAYPDLKLPAQVTKISAIPQSAGTFEARIAVELGKEAEGIMPGMACTIKLTAFQKAQALTVPATAVFSDDGDEDSHYVYLAVKSGKPQKRPVKVGKSADGKIEIVEGLHEGDEILTSKP